MQQVRVQARLILRLLLPGSDSIQTPDIRLSRIYLAWYFIRESFFCPDDLEMVRKGRPLVGDLHYFHLLTFKPPVKQFLTFNF